MIELLLTPSSLAVSLFLSLWLVQILLWVLLLLQVDDLLVWFFDDPGFFLIIIIMTVEKAVPIELDFMLLGKVMV